jgi:hypothetical protein
MTTQSSTQNTSPVRVKPLSETLQFLFQPKPVGQLTAEELFMVVKQAIATYGTKLQHVSSPFEDFITRPTEERIPASCPRELLSAQCILLGTISDTATSEEFLFLATTSYGSPCQKFFRCQRTLAKEPGPGVLLEDVATSCHAEYITEEEVRDLLEQQPHLCVHIVRTLRSASQVKLDHHNARAHEFGVIVEEIGKITSRISL